MLEAFDICSWVPATADHAFSTLVLFLGRGGWAVAPPALAVRGQWPLRARQSQCPVWPAARLQNADAWHRVAQPGVQAGVAPSSSCICPGGPQPVGLWVGAIDSANGIVVRRWAVAASVKLELVASV
jgi:hypothetical protein